VNDSGWNDEDVIGCGRGSDESESESERRKIRRGPWLN